MASKKEILTIILIIIATTVGYIAQSIITTGISVLMTEFNLTAGTAQWISTSYILVLGIMIPPTAYLTHRFKTKTIVCSSLIVFTLGSIISFITPNFELLLIGRILQAAGAGILMPVLQIAIFKVLPANKWNFIMSIVGLAIAVGPSLAPTIGGLIIDSYGWRTIFEILSIIGGIMLIIMALFGKNLSETEKYPLDISSLILSIFACTGLILGLSNISSFGTYSLYVWIPLIIGILSLILFVKRQKSLENPLLHLDVLKNKYFTTGTILPALMHFIVIGYTVILPIYVQNICGYSATIAGIVLLPGTLFMAFCNFIGPNLAEKIGVRKVLIISSILITIGVGSMVFYNQNTSINMMIISQLIRCGGIGLGMITISTWSLSIVTDEIEDATAITNTIRQITAAAGSALLAVMMTCIAGGPIVANSISVMAFDLTSGFTTLLGIICLILSILFVRNREEIQDYLKPKKN